MGKYHLMSIELGNSSTMNNLGAYHQDITKNLQEMEKYYLMAIELGNECSYKSFMDNSTEAFMKINSLDVPENIIDLQKKSINKEILS